MKPLLLFACVICVISGANYFAQWEFSAGLGWMIAALLFVEPIFGR